MYWIERLPENQVSVRLALALKCWIKFLCVNFFYLNSIHNETLHINYSLLKCERHLAVYNCLCVWMCWWVNCNRVCKAGVMGEGAGSVVVVVLWQAVYSPLWAPSPRLADTQYDLQQTGHNHSTNHCTAGTHHCTTSTQTLEAVVC